MERIKAQSKADKLSKKHKKEVYVIYDSIDIGYEVCFVNELDAFFYGCKIVYVSLNGKMCN